MIQGIAVTGISVEAPGVRNIHDFWQMISRGESRDGRFPAERRGAVEEFVTYLWDSALEGPQDRTVSFHNGYFMDLEDISSFDAPFFGMSPRQAATTDPHLRMILRNMYRAFEDGGYSADTISGTRTGVYVGYASNPTQTYMDYLSRIDTSLGITSLMGNIPTMMANRLSHHFNLLGPSMVVDTACSASLVALHHAKNALLLGECDQAVVAGARIVFAPVDHPQSRIGIESSDGVTRTFDDRADGTGLGEGSGAVLLKRLDQAVADGDRIYAVIRGSAVNHDGRTEIMTSPDSASQERLLRSAWDSAGIEPRTLGYVEVHGTATKVGDPIEFEGLRRAFAHYTPDRGFCAVGTVKANIGHLFEGSGIMGVIKSVLALRNREIPPQAHFQRPNSLIDFAGGPVYVPTSAQPWERNGTPRRCGVSAFGLGGTNCHVVLEEYAPADADADAAEDTGQPQLFTISARTAPSLRALIREYADFIAQGRFAGTALADLCYTSNVSRASHEHRLALLADDVEELRTGLLLALDDQGTEVGGRAGTGRRALLAERAEAYLNGEQLQVSDLYKDRSPRVVGLVPYQFDEARHWIEFPPPGRSRPRGAPGSRQVL